MVVLAAGRQRRRHPPAGILRAARICAARAVAGSSFAGTTLSSELRVGRGIAGITGSTLTSEAVTGGMRRALAIYAVLLKGQ